MKLRLIRSLLDTAVVLLGCPLPLWRQLKSVRHSAARELIQRHLPHLTVEFRHGIGDLARFARAMESPGSGLRPEEREA